MDLRYWLAEARSGTIRSEAPLSQVRQLTSRFGGGPCRVTLDGASMVNLDGSVSLPAIEALRDISRAGRASLVVTQGTRTVGEWLIWTPGDVSWDGSMPLAGMEWDGYPKFRSLNDNYIYKNVRQGTILHDLLADAFTSYQSMVEFTVPAWTFGPSRSMDHKSHTGYYQDLLDELEDPDDGVQWRVVPTVSWSGGRAVSVTRTVTAASPRLTRSVDERLWWDRGRGNLIDFPAPGVDFSRYAQSLYGWGAGEGTKQRWVGLSDPTLTNAGHLIVTKNVSFPGTTDVSTLTALTRGALTDAQTLADPIRATVEADGISSIPRVGDRLPVKIAPCAPWPDGLDSHFQVGEVALSPDGNRLAQIGLLARED